MKLNFFLTIFFFSVFIIGCKRKQSKIPDKEIPSQVNYKKWLKDTLTVLRQAQSINYCKYSINQDSSSLMITIKLDTLIEKNSIAANVYSAELKYPISLLQRNKIMPKKKFRLISITKYYFDLPYKNMNLTYDFQVDIMGFYIITDNFKREYNFMKGHLTESRSISFLPDLKSF